MANINTIRPEVAREIEFISSNNEHLNKSFDLQYLNPKLNEIEMVAIAEALSSNTHVEEVTLGWCLRDSPTLAVSTFLKKIFETHQSIRRLDLRNNGINIDLAEVIGLALKTNTSLTKLFLWSNNIGPQGAEALAAGLHHNKTLQILNLTDNHVGDKGAIALAEALRINKTLEELSLWDNGLAASGAKALASALEKASLKVLNLRRNYIHDEGGETLAKSLVNNKSLRRLVLENTGIGDGTCKALAAALCNNSTLRVLSISGNSRITDSGATSFEDTLKHKNHSVESIYFDYNYTRIYTLCANNIRVNEFVQRVNQNIPVIPLGAWPRVLEAVESKPDLLFALLKTKPEVCRELKRNQRKRGRPDG